jgi:hypothetical protein
MDFLETKELNVKFFPSVFDRVKPLKVASSFAMNLIEKSDSLSPGL